MATSPMSKVVGHLRKIAFLQECAGLNDAQLLETFLVHREEAAFEALVRRHGPMVLGVCRRVLHDRHDAEDAFQATFLVLIRKAAGIGKRELLANWLYGVAHRTALKAHKATARRRARERQVADMAPKQVTQDEAMQEMLPLLDQELSRLPDKYRVPIILCDLEGKTKRVAAQQLNLPERTLSTRLARARVMLAKRLARHGTTLSGSAVALALSQNMTSASVPPMLVSATVKIGALVVAGKTGAAGAISAKVAALTEGVVKGMLLTKLKTMIAVVLIVVGVGAFGGGLLAQRSAGKLTDDEVKQGTKSATRAQPTEPPKEFANSLGMKFVWIPPGTFMMGSPKDEQGRLDHETQHKVTLTKGFYMGVHLVTQEQWQAVMGNNLSEFSGEKNLPVDVSSWDDCQEFIRRLRAKDKKQYRLPTEAEWEYSCRAGTTTPFYFGEAISTDQANYDGEHPYPYGSDKKGENRKKTTPVGRFPANAFGLYDMHGNVWQWCQDWLGPYPKNAVVDPTGLEILPRRVVRGGSYHDWAVALRSAFRGSWHPSDHHLSCGFRVAMTYTADEAKQDTPPAKDEPHEAQDEAKKEKITRVDYFQVQKVDLKERTIRGAIGGSNLEQTMMSFNSNWELSIEPATKIVIDGKPAQLEGLQTLKGAAITTVDYEFDLSQEKKRLAGRLELGKGKAISIEAVAPLFIAYVRKIDSSKGSVVVKTVMLDPFLDTFTSWPLVKELPEDEKTKAFKFNPDVAVILDNKPARPADLKPKMLVMLQMSAVEDRVFRITAFGPAVIVVLKTVDINANTISARIPLVNVTAQNLRVAKDAKVVINGREGKLSDLKAGMRVWLQMSAEADDSYIIGITVGKEPKEIDQLRFLPPRPA